MIENTNYSNTECNISEVNEFIHNLDCPFETDSTIMNLHDLFDGDYSYTSITTSSSSHNGKKNMDDSFTSMMYHKKRKYNDDKNDDNSNDDSNDKHHNDEEECEDGEEPSDMETTATITETELISLSSNEQLDLYNELLSVSLNTYYSDVDLYKFPNIFFGAVNSANFHLLKKLLQYLFHSQCVLKWSRKAYSIEKVGSDQMIGYFDAWMNSVPDIVIVIKNVSQVTNIKTGIKILKCKLRYSGTVLFSHYMDEYRGFRVIKKNIVDYMDTSKLSLNEIERIQKEYQNIIKSDQVVQFYAKLQVNFYIDTLMNKVIGYEDKSTLTSFKGVSKCSEGNHSSEQI